MTGLYCAATGIAVEGGFTVLHKGQLMTVSDWPSNTKDIYCRDTLGAYSGPFTAEELGLRWGSPPRHKPQREWKRQVSTIDLQDAHQRAVMARYNAEQQERSFEQRVAEAAQALYDGAIVHTKPSARAIRL